MAVACQATTPALAGPALVFEAKSGRVLYAEDATRPWYPASIVKMMTAYLAFEAVRDGRLDWSGTLYLSDNARGQPATRMGLRAGLSVTVEQAVRALIMRSANDFAMALAENISGGEMEFVDEMNATALRLGMLDTRFKNPHGLPDPEQVTTALDYALLTQALLRDFPQYADVFSTATAPIAKGVMHSSNDLLRTLPGTDGMKTGFTCWSGYNIVASATRDGVRLVAVVMGERTRGDRSLRTAALLERGFQMRRWKELLGAPRLSELQRVTGPVGPLAGKALKSNRCSDAIGPPEVVVAMVKARQLAAEAAAAAAAQAVVPAASAPHTAIAAGATPVASEAPDKSASEGNEE